MLAGERAMAEEMEVREIEDVDLIPLDKEEVQRPAHTVMLQDIVNLLARRNILRNYQNLRKENNRKRPIPAEIRVTAKRTALHLTLPQHLFPMNFIHLRP